MITFLADVRLVARAWLKAPGFAAIAILSIALGIGANAAVFTLVDQILLRMLPVKEPHELVQVTYSGNRYGSNWGDGPYTVIGVARAGFDGIEIGRQTQVYVPLMMKAQITPTWDAPDQRLSRWVRVFGRLAPGVTRDQAKAALDPFYAGVLERDLADSDFARAAQDTRQRYAASMLTLADGSQGRSKSAAQPDDAAVRSP